MYTINLNQISIEPKIDEVNKIFEDETKSGVVKLAVNYINTNHKDMYNINLLEQKCAEAVYSDGVPADQGLPE